MAFFARSSGRPVRHLEWRIRLMGAGALLALIGMYYQARWLIWIAIAVLIVGFLLRFAAPKGEFEPPDAPGWDDDDREDEEAPPR